MLNIVLTISLDPASSISSQKDLFLKLRLPYYTVLYFPPLELGRPGTFIYSGAFIYSVI